MKEKLNLLFPAIKNSYFGIPILLLTVLAMVILPLPPVLLDALFIFNIVLSVIVLLVAVSSKRPLEFSVFPTILLIATLMRLTLNVASTRIVLTPYPIPRDAMPSPANCSSAGVEIA